MLWFYEHLEFFVLGLFVSGITLHFVMRRLERQRYMVLRAAYEDAVRDSRESDGDPAAVVREAELHRAFMSSRMPGWFEGFGRSLRTVMKVSAGFTLLALFLKGPIERGEADYANRQAKAAQVTSAQSNKAGARMRAGR